MQYIRTVDPASTADIFIEVVPYEITDQVVRNANTDCGGNLFKRVIANSELKVLKVLLEAGREMTIKEMRKILVEKTDWEVPTIKTLVYRLYEKGVINAEKREVFYYTPRRERTRVQQLRNAEDD